ncbi:MAG: FAD-dependent oxidoreductase [Oligoflexales bacterium]|nr:FAD-dependent oxidoreductase [Oligoflexales bacterium]
MGRTFIWSYLRFTELNKKITIIGRGIIGLANAFELLRRGCTSVTVIGPREKKGVASYAAVGISSIKGLRVARDDFFREKLLGHARFSQYLDKISQSSGLKIPVVHGVGEYFANLEQYQQLHERTYHGEFKGLYNVQIHGADQLQKYKLLSARRKSKAVLGTYFYPNDLWFHPTFLMKALELAIVKLGGKIENGRIESITPHQDRGFQVVSDTHAYHCEELVLAAGEGVVELVSDLSTVDFPFLKIGGQTLLVSFDMGGNETFRIGRKALSAYQSELRYGSIDFDKNQVPGAHDLELGEQQLVNELGRDFSIDASQLETESLWGMRLALKDRRPILGSLPCKEGRRLWMSCGYHKSGYSLAEFSATVLADQLLGAQAKVDQFYSVSRFFGT